MSKGDTTRPRNIDKQTYDDNWDRTFKQQENVTNDIPNDIQREITRIENELILIEDQIKSNEQNEGQD